MRVLADLRRQAGNEWLNSHGVSKISRKVFLKLVLKAKFKFNFRSFEKLKILVIRFGHVCRGQKGPRKVFLGGFSPSGCSQLKMFCVVPPFIGVHYDDRRSNASKILLWIPLIQISGCRSYFLSRCVRWPEMRQKITILVFCRAVYMMTGNATKCMVYLWKWKCEDKWYLRWLEMSVGS